MTLRLTIDDRDPTPPYAQLRSQLESAILGGVLEDGRQLPPVRQLAADLGVATGTVAKVYKELEQAGLVRTARGAGTRVVAPDQISAADAARRAEQVAVDAVTRFRALGVPDEEALELVRRAQAAPSGSARLH